MRLRKLELYGFKSFAQRTEITFTDGITGIVGPNGSGKSNISDAVRWVLGEQSAKTLRGASMQDVIFNGTQRRKALGYCEVSLVFDNEDRSLPVPYSEVMVTRRVFRTGESEYYLNRTACRLKDVIDLFRDTGIGREGYSIIGQGRIDEILSRRGEDRRQVFEEAAGIVKYRARKEEADRKLDRTKENLARVDDILEELSRQLAPLEEQARNARVYLDLSSELKVLDLNLFLVRSDRMEARLRENDRDLQNLQTALAETESTLGAKAEERDARQAEITELDGKIAEAHAGQLEGMQAVHDAENALQVILERRKNRTENRERIGAEAAEAQEALTRLDAQLAEGGESEETRGALLREREEELARARAAEAEARTAEEAADIRLEAEKSAMLDALNRRAMAQNDQTRLHTMLTTMENRLEEVTVSRDDMRRGQTVLEEEAAGARRRLKEETERQEDLTRGLSEVRNALETSDAAVIRARTDYDAQLVALREADSRRKVLAEMSREMEGYSNTVRSVMRLARERGMKTVRGTVGQLLGVPKEYETAMDMALGAAQQQIVTEDEETAKTLIGYLREHRLGRATFLPMNAVRGRTLTDRERELLRMPGCLGVASELVEYAPEYRDIAESLLGRTVVADSLDHGIPIMRRGNHAFRLVTLQGDVMHSGGSMTGGSTASRTVNLFSRERELKELTEKLTAGQRELERLLRALHEGQERKDSLKRESADALEALHQQEIAVARETERVRNAEEELRTHCMRLSETEAAREQLMESILQVREQLSMVSGNTEESEVNREETERRTEEARRSLTEARKRTEAAEAETLRLTLEVSELRHGIEDSAREQRRRREERERILREQQRREENLRGMAEADARDAEEAAGETVRLETARLEQARREKTTQSLETDRNRRQALLKEILTDMENLHQAQQRDTDRAHRLELSRSRTEGDLKALRDRIWNTYELTYAGAEPFRQAEGFSLTDADRRAAELSAQIRALGPVNVRAVEEYADTKARHDDMSAQRKDLEQAEKDLRQLIGQLLDRMRETFTEQFGLMQGYFAETFRKLFGGGRAELALADPSDPLNCGIDISVQPPGKKLQLLSLLSGGERTLTAIAILFAMLKLKPTPFCILDEIEAALDDANIGYFADYLAEFSRSTQFVVITHRKGTMERADSLYGVAMEEQGVSRMVSVSLENYHE